ncbi:alkaline phytoceramidase [Aulographum hederae CBS 113979]|uniref:Alkaline phytoceramidase n=1 Tax=Aulographum hederae CBS 113979 TaxID=1176131 RepID=A0A6G1HA95_9PEZI|nr:alkaline phytoceramidase [Aulographum hederae CBS 113979]
MGHHNRVFNGDPRSHLGYWGTPTSNANFCEEDYAVTLYIAEFINSLTNLAYVYLALRYRPSKSYLKLDFMSTSLILVGLTSFIFHATLRQTLQYFDDLSMFLLAGSLLQPLYCMNQSAHLRLLVSAVITVAISTMAAIYVRSGDIRIHMYAFAFMLHLIWPRTLYLIHSKSLNRTEGEKKVLMRRFYTAVGSLVLAYAIWNVDLEKCAELRAFRERLGVPLQWLFELHGWWHVGTAVGASEYIRLIRALGEREERGKGKKA